MCGLEVSQHSTKMAIIGILMLVLVEQSLQQAPTLTKYKRILVTGESFHKMKIKNYIDDGADRKRLIYIAFWIHI